MSSQMSAVELLKLGNEGRPRIFINEIWAPLLGVTFGLGAGAIINIGTRRPILSGIQKYVYGIAGFTALFMFLDKKRIDYYAERDAVLRYYVETHPEDFPTPERKKIGDIVEPWIPIR